MRGSADRVAECTSLTFDGMIAMIEPTESWVARWQRIGELFRPDSLGPWYHPRESLGILAGKETMDVVKAVPLALLYPRTGL